MIGKTVRVRVGRTAGWILASSLLFVSGCGGETPPGASAPQSAPYPVMTVVSSAGLQEQRIDGRLEGFEQTTILAQLAGEVTEIHAEVGARVRAGELLMRVRATSQQGGLAQAQAALREARARDTDAAARYARIAGLYERKVVPRALFEETTAAREAAAAQLTAAQAQLAAAEGYTAIRAGFDGLVTARHVTAGSQVMPGTPLIGVAAVDRLRVTASLPAVYAASVQARGEVFLVRGGERIALTNVRVTPQVGVQSGAFGLQADLPAGTADVVPGMIAALAIVGGEAMQRRVPLASVVERGEVTGAYVFDAASGRTSFRQLRLGRQVGADVEVLAGLRDGDQVALEPGAALRHLGIRSAE